MNCYEFVDEADVMIGANKKFISSLINFFIDSKNIFTNHKLDCDKS